MGLAVVCALLLAGAWLGDGATIPESYDTIVVGLGAAGVTAASALASRGYRVLGLEAQDRIGGRVKTVAIGDGVVEVGAEWIHGIHPSRTYDLAIANNVTLQTQDFSSLKLIRSDGKPVAEYLDSFMMELFEHCMSAIDNPPEEPGPLGVFLNKTVIDYIREKKPELLNDMTTVHGLLDLLDLFVCTMEGGNSWMESSTLSQYTELEGDQYTSWHKHGYKTLFEIILKTYNNGPGLPNLETKLNTEVTQISYPQDPEKKVAVTCKDGTVYTADNVIVTVSLGVLKDRHTSLFSPPLPQDKVTSIEKISIGCVGKLIMIFPNQWWDPEKSYGFLWTAEDREKLPEEDKWTSHLTGPSMSLGNNQTLTMWSTGDITKKIESLPEDLVKEKAMGLLRRFIVNVTIPEPTGIIKSNWCTYPYTLGTYSFDNVLTPQYPEARMTLRSPLNDEAGNPRVLFAGEATHSIYFSTVHGAASTGHSQAMELIARKQNVTANRV